MYKMPSTITFLFFIIASVSLSQLSIANPKYENKGNVAYLLIASRQMEDPRFKHAILLITHSGKSGTAGFIINKATDIYLGIDPADKSASEQVPVQLYFGGPVKPRAITYLFRATKAPEETLHISGDIFLTFDERHIREQLNTPDHKKTLRAFSGYASWAPGQLEYEIELGAWYRTKLDDEVIFQPDMSKIWQQMILRFDGTLIET